MSGGVDNIDHGVGRRWTKGTSSKDTIMKAAVYILYMYDNCGMKCLYETDVFYKIGSWRRNVCNERENIHQQNIGFDITCVWYTLIIFICALLLQRKSCTVYLYWCHILWTIMLVYWYRDFYYYTKDSKNTSCAMDIRTRTDNKFILQKIME